MDIPEVDTEGSGAIGQRLFVGHALKVAFEPRLAPHLLSLTVPVPSQRALVVVRTATLTPVLILEQRRRCNNYSFE